MKFSKARLQRACFMSIAAFGLLGVSTATLLPAQSIPFQNPYLPVHRSGNPTTNFTPYNVSGNTPTGNDCSTWPSTFNSQDVLYVGMYGTYDNGSLVPNTTPPTPTSTSPSQALQLTSNVVAPGQLVCVYSGTYAPFQIKTSGSPTVGYTSFEVPPGQQVKIDLDAGGTNPYYNGITVANNTWVSTGSNTGYFVYANISYVVIDGFYIQGPVESIPQSFWTDVAGTTANELPYYNANGITVFGDDMSPSPNPNFTVVNGKPTWADHIYIVGNYIDGCSGAGIATFSTDYTSINGNTVSNSVWYTIYGSSGISMLGSYDSNTSDDYISSPPSGYPNYNYRNYVINNTVFNNFEFVSWLNYGITDGEGIIIDTGLNSDYVNQTFGADSTYVDGYYGHTLVENNAVYNNGSAGIEVFASANVDIMYNSLFNNDLNSDEYNKGEIYINDAFNVKIGDNILYSSYYDTPVKQLVTSNVYNSGNGGYQYPVYSMVANSDPSRMAAALTPQYFANLAYAYQGTISNVWAPGYEPAAPEAWQANHFADPHYTVGEVSQTTDSFGTVNYDTTPSIYSINMAIQPSYATDPNIHAGGNSLMLPNDINGTARVPSYSTYPIGAYYIAY